MVAQPSLFDRDLSRGRNHPQSKAAHESLLPHKPSLRERCLDLIAMSGKQGATLRELSGHLNRPMHSLSGRISELKERGLVQELPGVTRDGCSVLVKA